MLEDTDYQEFVQSVTSEYSKNHISMLRRMEDLFVHSNGEFYDMKISHLLTAALGLTGEAGEFADHVKKVVFHGKDLDKVRRQKMILELGDVMWYVMQACKGLDTTLEDVVRENVDKLSKRHDGGFKKDYKS
jgi:NTP pyrophosphatase (non-canonical NTP hydrolase)